MNEAYLVSQQDNVTAFNSACWVVFMNYLLSADIFQHYFFQNITIRIISECQTA